MDSDGLPLIGPGLDFTKIGAIHQKRTLAFLNHFVTHTANFLNRFSCTCEDKLANISLRIQRLETTISILEAKLNSVPGLEGVTVPTSTSTTAPTASPDSAAPDTTQTQAQQQQQQQQTQQVTEPTPTPDAPPPPPPQDVPKISQDPVYAKYFKMQAMGVPAMAVKNKMVMEGLNADLLDNPDAPAPTGSSGIPGTEDSDGFSDDDEQEDSDQAQSNSSDDFSD